MTRFQHAYRLVVVFSLLSVFSGTSLSTDWYAIVVSDSTIADSGWAEVVDTLRVKYDGQVFTYDADIWELQQALSTFCPDYICFVVEPLEASASFVGEVWQFTRALDDDPYGDAIWGIVTGYTSEDALRIVSTTSGFLVKTVLSGSGAGWLPWVVQGMTTSESQYHKRWFKYAGDTLVVEDTTGPTDRTEMLVDYLNADSFDIFITSGHGNTNVWQLHYPNPDSEGFFRSNAGQVYGDPHSGPDVNISSQNPKIYFGLGNCYIGKIDNMNCMALAWIHTGGAYQYAGYVIEEGTDSYQLGGIPHYFFLQQGYHTWAESFYLTNQALLFDLENHTPGTNPSDKDGAALYGDPKLDVRVDSVRNPLYDEEITVTPGYGSDTITVTIRMNDEGRPGFNGKWGNRHPMVILPFRVDSVEIQYTDAYEAVVTDNFALMWVWEIGDSVFLPGTERTVIFTAKTLDRLAGPPSSPRGLIATPLYLQIELTWKENWETDLAGYNIYRSTSSGGSYERLNATPLVTNDYVDDSLSTGVWYYYVVTAIDTTEEESSNSLEAEARCISLDQGILLVDETKDGSGSTPVSPTDAQVDSFYQSILNDYSFTNWDCASQGEPSISDLGAYSTILWHGDDFNQQQIYPVLEDLRTYLDAGGRLWLVGWRPIQALMRESYPYSFQEGDFPYDYLKLTWSDDSIEDDFTSASGCLGYPDVTVDSTKLLPSWTAMKYIDVFTPYEGEVIYTFNSASGDTSFQDKACGIRWFSGSRKLVFFGFPLYFMKEDEARLVTQIVMDDFGETGVDQFCESITTDLKLLQNCPNPFHSKTEIHYSSQRGKVSVKVYDIAGRLVSVLVDCYKETGVHKVNWDGKDDEGRAVPTGVYFYRLLLDNNLYSTKKMVLLR